MVSGHWGRGRRGEHRTSKWEKKRSAVIGKEDEEVAAECIAL
jgi:hypothetical protein